MYKSSFYKMVFPALAVMLFSSCDKDFNEIGADIIGDDHFDFVLSTNEIVANTVGSGAVQSNNLPINPLGIYDSPAFGKTKAHFVTQVELAAVDPTIGTNITDVEVTLSIPYFSTLVTTNTDGSKTYELDSIYGGDAAKINLAVYRSGYFLGDIAYEGEEQVAQIYYSNQNDDISNVKMGSPLNNGAAAENTDFAFTPEEEVDEETDDDGNTEIVRSAPELRLTLDSQYFEDIILNAGEANLLSNNAFRNYFRGLYFQVQDHGTSHGALAMLDFKKGKVSIKYKANVESTSSTGVVTNPVLDREVVLNMTGNTISLLEHLPSPNYGLALSQPLTQDGQSRIYIKGGQGSVAKIDLFDTTDISGGAAGAPNDIPDVIDQMREDGWLINEANLTVYIDKNAMLGTSEPDRLYTYYIPNRTPTLDHLYDNTTNSNVKYGKSVLGGIIEKGEDNRGIRYKIRVTNYVRSLIRSDSTYVPLGLSVTEDINLTQNAKLRTPSEPLNNYIPIGSVLSPLGTVLYGNNIPVGSPDYDKRMRLEIYYTKPN